MTALSIDWSSGLTSAWTNLSNFVPKLLLFVVILIIGIIIAKVVTKVLGVLLGKIGFDSLLNKAGAGTFARSGIDPQAILLKLVHYFILLLALQLALAAFGPTNPLTATVNSIVAWLPNLVVAIVIVLIASAIANAVKDLLASSLGNNRHGPLLTKIAGGLILALGVIAALNQIGIGTTVTGPVLIAVLATVGGVIVVGFGGGLIGPAAKRWEGWLDGLSTGSAPAQPPVQPPTQY